MEVANEEEEDEGEEEKEEEDKEDETAKGGKIKDRDEILKGIPSLCQRENIARIPDMGMAKGGQKNRQTERGTDRQLRHLKSWKKGPVHSAKLWWAVEKTNCNSGLHHHGVKCVQQVNETNRRTHSLSD